METVTHILIENQEKGVGNLTKVMPTSPVFLSVFYGRGWLFKEHGKNDVGAICWRLLHRVGPCTRKTKRSSLRYV